MPIYRWKTPDVLEVGQPVRIVDAYTDGVVEAIDGPIGVGRIKVQEPDGVTRKHRLEEMLVPVDRPPHAEYDPKTKTWSAPWTVPEFWSYERKAVAIERTLTDVEFEIVKTTLRIAEAHGSHMTPASIGGDVASAILAYRRRMESPNEERTA